LKVDLPSNRRGGRAEQGCEAMECAASLDVRKLRRVVVPERHEYGSRLIESVLAMLTKMR